MNRYEGDLVAQPGVIYDYTEITGWLYAHGADTRTAFPRLTTVGGWLNAYGADTRTAFPRLTTVGGTLYASGADTRAAFPRLTHTNDRDAARRAFLAAGYSWDDGILSEIVAKRGRVMRVRVVGQTWISYVVTDGTLTAHGRTLAEARADLRIKQGPRDTSAYAHWTPETMVSQEEAIAAYRAVTGACGAGVSAFLASRQIPARLPVRRIVEETVGAYGHEQFAAFVRSHDETPAVAAN